MNVLYIEHATKLRMCKKKISTMVCKTSPQQCLVSVCVTVGTGRWWSRAAERDGRLPRHHLLWPDCEVSGRFSCMAITMLCFSLLSFPLSRHIPNCSHWVQQDVPDLCNQYITDFLCTKLVSMYSAIMLDITHPVITKVLYSAWVKHYARNFLFSIYVHITSVLSLLSISLC